MNKENQLVKYEKKIVIESIIFSAILGIIIGLSISFFLTIIFYFCRIVRIDLIFVIGGGSTLISSILLYFFKLKPNRKSVAKRVDNIGLEERVITMLELEEKDSFMVNLQRNDAKEKLSKTNPKALQFKSFRKPIITLLAVLIISFTTLIFYSQVVYAKYSKDYLVTFNSQGGTVVEDQTIEGGQLIDVPKDPKREGFDFYYWYQSDINVSFDFNTPIFEDTTLYARWEVKSDEDKIIEQLIKGLRDIVARADVSEELKTDLYQYIDALEESLKKDDTLETKLAKIEYAREEILRRIQEEIDNIIKIGDALKEFETTTQLGDAILTKKPTDIDNAIDNLVDTLLSIEDRTQQIEALLQTADDIEAALEIATEKNPPLRKTLQDLADYLRYLAEEIIEGDIPEDVLDNEFIEEMDNTKQELKDILGEDSQSQEEQLAEDVDSAVDDAIDQLTDDNAMDDENDNNQDEESNNGSGDQEGDQGNPNADDLIPSIIDGQTQYILMLEQLKENAGLKLLDPTLTQEQRDALNKYINNIDMELEEFN